MCRHAHMRRWGVMATQQSGTTIPTSRLNRSSLLVSLMCRASFNLSMSCLFALSITFVLSQRIGWCSDQACSAMADLSNCPQIHASLCSFNLVSNHLTVSPMYIFPQVHGTWYTTLDSFPMGSLSFTLVNFSLKVMGYSLLINYS